MKDSIKIRFKRSILVSEIQSKLKELDEFERKNSLKCIYFRNEIDRGEDIPLYVKYYIKKNYTDKIAILNFSEITKLFAIPSVTKLINYNEDECDLDDEDCDSVSYARKLLSGLFKFSKINKYYRTKIKGTLSLGDYYKNFKYLITEFYAYVKMKLKDTCSTEMYIFRIDEDNNLIIPDFGNDDLKIDVLREDVLDTSETRQMFLNRI